MTGEGNQDFLTYIKTMRVTKDYVFFYKDWLSNYQRTSFQFPSLVLPLWTFTSTEQGFMFLKALFFKDFETAEKIINTDDPDKCRRLGRQVKNYEENAWDRVRYALFYDLNLQKYSQDYNLKSKLMSPEFKDKKFVEASPIDLIWGIGMGEWDKGVTNENKWKGQNYLGRIITTIRDRLEKEEAARR
jgi:hypothetical protein